jgi:hypothetical protein
VDVGERRERFGGSDRISRQLLPGRPGHAQRLHPAAHHRLVLGVR